MTVSAHKVVSIHYELKDDSGNLLQSNDGHAPEDYLHGAGNVIPGLERVLEGSTIGQVIEAIIPHEWAYGPRELSLVFEVALADIPDPAVCEPGEVVELFDGTEALVIENKEDLLIVDANHPLAGMSLHYTVRISGIRDATNEEIRNGEPYAPLPGCSGEPGCC